jgi:hypothetical protein
MSDNGMLSYEKAVEAARSITGQIRRLEDEITQAMSEHADAEAGFRAQYALKLREHRETGATVAESEAFAHAACAVLNRDRIKAEHRVRDLLERLEDRRGERHSLHRLMDWAMPSRPGPS